jgi:predicted flavoprotein YhiN
MARSELARRLAVPRRGATLTNHLRKAAHLDPVAIGLLRETALPEEPAALAERIKAVPLKISGLAPLDRAISTAGGVAWSGLDTNLMSLARPGLFVAGEMLDWEAPTGGYLLQATFATAARAGNGLLDWLAANDRA